LSKGYYDDFSDDIEKEHLLGDDEDEDENDDDDDDDEGFGTANRESVQCILNTRRAVVLELAYSNLLPPPTIRASIVGTRNITDAYSKEYTQYEVEVTQGKLRWNIYRRFKEFKGLHTALKVKSSGINTSLLPKLPPKQVNAGEGGQMGWVK
jgi:hypothetical protein